MIRWKDAYKLHTETLDSVIAGLGKICITETQGKIVHEDPTYIVLEQNRVESEETGDYMVIPKSLIVKGQYDA